MQNIAIIFKRKKLKNENKYKLTPLWYITGNIINEDKLTYFKTDEEIIETNSKKVKGMQNEYRFSDDINALNEEYIYAFPMTIKQIERILESDSEEDLQLFLEEYIEAINCYNYYQTYDEKNQAIYSYSVPKNIAEKEYLDMSKENITAIEEYLGIDKTQFNETPNTNEEKQTNKPSAAPKHINIKNLYVNITSSLIGQDEQVKAVLSAIDINQTITNPRLKQNILICGDTGTGKTEIFRLIGKNLNIPYVVEDANQYTMEGYVGNSISDMLSHLLVKADGDLNKAQRGILIVDEIDKKASGTTQEKVATTGVLEGLLKLMEGGTYNFEYQKNRTIPFDTTNMTFVAMGAFSGLNEIANPKTVGFNKADSKKESPFTTDNFNKFGLLPEFIGRCNRKIIMNPMTQDILYQILTTSSNSPITLIEELFKNYGVNVTYDDLEIINKAIVEYAIELKTGARALFEIVFSMVEKAIFQVQCERSYKKLILKKETIKDNNDFILS